MSKPKKRKTKVKSSPWTKPKVKLIIDYPFFGMLTHYLIEVDSTDKIDVETCATDGEHLFFNTNFLNTLSEGEKIFVLAHEILHCALGHVWLHRRETRDPELWNIAADYVVNLILKDEIDSAVRKNIRKQSLMQMPKGIYLDSRFCGMSVEEVYEILNKEGGLNKLGGNGMPLSQRDIRPDLYEKSMKNNPEQSDNQSQYSVYEMEKRMKDLANKWKNRVVSAAYSAKQRGNIPAGLKRFIDELINPKLPWQVIVERFVNDSIRDDYDWLKRDKRFVTRGIFLPDANVEGANIAIGIDTSGSISPQELKEYISELFGILRTKKIKTVRVLACDADIHADITLTPYDNIEDHLEDLLKGGGGTRFEPVFERLQETNYRPACLIYFTDTYGSFPNDAPSYPVLWVTKNMEKELPYGMTIEL